MCIVYTVDMYVWVGSIVHLPNLALVVLVCCMFARDDPDQLTLICITTCSCWQLTLAAFFVAIVLDLLVAGDCLPSLDLVCSGSFTLVCTF
jgi:hypothetical protein